jgi:hypothetical protein
MIFGTAVPASMLSAMALSARNTREATSSDSYLHQQLILASSRTELEPPPQPAPSSTMNRSSPLVAAREVVTSLDAVSLPGDSRGAPTRVTEFGYPVGSTWHSS